MIKSLSDRVIIPLGSKFEAELKAMGRDLDDFNLDIEVDPVYASKSIKPVGRTNFKALAIGPFDEAEFFDETIRVTILVTEKETNEFLTINFGISLSQELKDTIRNS